MKTNLKVFQVPRVYKKSILSTPRYESPTSHLHFITDNVAAHFLSHAAMFAIARTNQRKRNKTPPEQCNTQPLQYLNVISTHHLSKTSGVPALSCEPN